ncbi:MAG: hypothetical protein NWR42_04095, partial [Desulfobacterales bacterium]|nr:hypothetical protein [Desulfobacterales bacterium]
ILFILVPVILLMMPGGSGVTLQYYIYQSVVLLCFIVLGYTFLVKDALPKSAEIVYERRSL